MAVKDLADKGVASIEYLSGHRDYMDVAVRRAAVTGVNQTALKLQERLADEMGCDLVEVTAHAGARNTGEGPANHAGWQGKIYSRSGTHPKYSHFAAVTGYGTGEGLGGWNCRHSWFPTFEGMEPVYTQEELEDMNAPKYEYNGRKLTEYEAVQQQRYIERNIRKSKRYYKAQEAAGLPTDEAAAGLAQWQEKQREFLRQTGLKRQYDRENVEGFGKNEAQKASHSVLKDIRNRESFIQTLESAEKTVYNFIKPAQTEPMLRIPQFPASDITKKVEEKEYSLALSHQQYLKHVGGTAQYNAYLASRAAKGGNPQSILTISEGEAQAILREKAGTGIIRADRKGNPRPVESVTLDKAIGMYYAKGAYHPTNKASIHYGQRASHIVPIRGDDYD